MVLERFELEPEGNQDQLQGLGKAKVLRVVHRFAARQHRAVLSKRCGSANEGADRHDMRRTHRLQPANIGVGGKQCAVGCDAAVCRLDDDLA